MVSFIKEEESEMGSDNWQQGVRSALPIVFGYTPIGLAFGVLATQAGLTEWQVLLMSLLVYAGSSQFIAVSLLAAEAMTGTIVATTFLVNSRHILMSASLAPHYKHFSIPLLAILSFGITDETYAVTTAELTKGAKTPGYLLGLNATAQFWWVLSTVAGARAGSVISHPEAFGLNYALPAMFIGLLIMQIKGSIYVIAALLAAVLAVAFKIYLGGNWHVILATVIAATMGVIIEQWKKKSSRSSSV